MENTNVTEQSTNEIMPMAASGETNFASLTEKTTPASGDMFLMEDSEDTKKINYDKLADAILNKLTSKTYSGLETTAKNFVTAINELNSKSITIVSIDITDGSNIDDLGNGIYFCNGYEVLNVPRYGTFISAKTANGAAGFQCIIITTGTIIIRQYGKSTGWSEWA